MQALLITEKAKYLYKSTDPIIEIKADSSKPIQMSGTLTFLDSVQAQGYYTKLVTTLKSADVLYAKIDLTLNSHHWSDDRVQPDVILGQTILGDANAVYNFP